MIDIRRVTIMLGVTSDHQKVVEVPKVDQKCTSGEYVYTFWPRITDFSKIGDPAEIGKIRKIGDRTKIRPIDDFWIFRNFRKFAKNRSDHDFSQNREKSKIGKIGDRAKNRPITDFSVGDENRLRSKNRVRPKNRRDRFFFLTWRKFFRHGPIFGPPRVQNRSGGGPKWGPEGPQNRTKSGFGGCQTILVKNPIFCKKPRYKMEKSPFLTEFSFPKSLFARTRYRLFEKFPPKTGFWERKKCQKAENAVRIDQFGGKMRVLTRFLGSLCREIPEIPGRAT